MSEKKIVGITMGDPASIGPEITVKAFADKSLYDTVKKRGSFRYVRRCRF